MDAQQPPVSGAPAVLQDLRVDARSVIADTQAKRAIIVPNVGFDLTCMCVAESISQHLAGDPVHFVLQDRRQNLLLAFHCHTEGRRIEVRIQRARQILTRRSQQLCKIGLNGRNGT